jgi:thioredoxin-related protein
MIKLLIYNLIVLLTLQSALAQKSVKWKTFEEAVKSVEQKPRKIFIDMYTDWCGWCKKMDKDTFENPVIAEYINKHFYPVKFDAERKDTVMFMGHRFVNTNPERSRHSHELARTLLNGKMSYPSFVFMDEELRVITVVPGYFPPTDFEPVLHFFATNAYRTTSWEDFKAKFKVQEK